VHGQTEGRNSSPGSPDNEERDTLGFRDSPGREAFGEASGKRPKSVIPAGGPQEGHRSGRNPPEDQQAGGPGATGRPAKGGQSAQARPRQADPQ